MTFYRLCDPQLWDKIEASIGQTGGLYRLRCLHHPRGVHFRPVMRITGKDSEGILYIDCAKVLATRVAFLQAALQAANSDEQLADPNIHAVGKFYLNGQVRHQYPYDCLGVTIEPMDSPFETIHATRQRALDAYIQRIGETPPFNNYP